MGLVLGLTPAPSRADETTSPSFAREGKDMLHGGGSLFLESQDPFIGPGHANVWTTKG
jgi:hypothetical protein